MERRKLLLGTGSLAAGSAAVLGTGAFTSVEANRTVSIDVAEDSDAYLRISAADTANGDEYADETDGTFEITIDRLNARAETIIDDLFVVENQGTQPVGVFIREFNTVDGVEELTFVAQNGTETPLIGEDEAVRLDVGESFIVGVQIEVARSEPDEGLIEGNNVTLEAIAAQSDTPRLGETTISSIEELRNLADPQNNEYPLDGDYALTSDIDLTGENVAPIGGIDEDPFSGTLDGRGHEISGAEPTWSGLFYAIEGEVKNLQLDVIAGSESATNVGTLAASNLGTITNVSATGEVHGSEWVGGLIGSNYGMIEDSSAACNVTGGSYLGGLTAYNGTYTDNGSIVYGPGTVKDSSASGDVTNADRNGEMFGGLIGQNWDGDVIRCAATGNVTSTDAVFDNAESGAQPFEAGGLIGYLNDDSDGATVEESLATGDVNIPGQQVGGLIGELPGTAENVVVADSYALGDVKGNEEFGGFIGTANSGEIETSYAAGSVEHVEVDVSSPGRVNGFIGEDDGVERVANSYWDVPASGREAGEFSAGTGLGNIEDEPPADEMTGDNAPDNMDGFDFNDRWETVENGYPDLRNVPRSG